MKLPPRTGNLFEAYDAATNRGVAAKLAVFDTIYIDHPRMQKLHGRFDALRRLGQATGGRPQKGLRMIGPSGSGKTKAIEKYIEQVASTEEHPAGVMPILHVPLSHNATTRRLWIDVLNQFDDDFSDRGNEGLLKKRAYKFIRKAGVELIFIDEVQHLFHREGGKTAWNVTEALKRALDDGVAPMVFAGTDEARDILMKNLQLSNRLVMPCDLDPLDITHPEDFELFVGFCGHLDRRIVEAGLMPSKAGLLGGSTLACLHEVSGGVLGVVVNLMRAALEIALRRSASMIETYDLALATDRWAIDQGFATMNPFRDGPTSMKVKE